jgi:superfamily II DNA/RNA helicase
LQAVYSRSLKLGEDAKKIDGFWTIVGYFNAIRELSGSRSLYRQDIPERIGELFGTETRPILEEGAVELSGQTDSLELSSILDSLETSWPEAKDAVFSTSMFGTGVDISRLGLMIVHGQPKTSSSYIQATGRVGREGGGLVFTFHRASRPRDLNHYEFFTGYHSSLYKFVEAVTVSPFSPRILERCAGPVATSLLRQARSLNNVEVKLPWRIEQRISSTSSSGLMSSERNALEVKQISKILEARAQEQTENRRPGLGEAKRQTDSQLDKWCLIANQYADLLYHETSMLKTPTHHVVLGDPQHHHSAFDSAFDNSPNSLREVESTITFSEDKG